MRFDHRPTDLGGDAPPAPGPVRDAVSGALGRDVDLRTHPWHVSRRIHMGDGVVVRDAAEGPGVWARAERELSNAVLVGASLCQQPLVPVPVAAPGRVLSLWRFVPGRVGRNCPEEARVTAGMLRRLHACDVSGVPEVGCRLDGRRELLDGTHPLHGRAVRHLEQARSLWDALPGAAVDGLLHGDAHGGNVIFSGAGLVGTFVDVEGAGCGDAHWDVAVLARSSRMRIRGDAVAVVASWYGGGLCVERLRALAYVRAASTLPVKLSSPGLANLDFSGDVAEMDAQWRALGR